MVLSERDILTGLALQSRIVFLGWALDRERSSDFTTS